MCNMSTEQKQFDAMLKFLKPSGQEKEPEAPKKEDDRDVNKDTDLIKRGLLKL